MERVRICLDHPNAKMPTQATSQAQCFDLYAAEDAVLQPGTTTLVSLGIKMILPEGFGLEFRERSGLALKGVIIGAGVIDEDYQGVLGAVVRYMPRIKNRAVAEAFEIKAGDKILQAELVRRIPVELEELDAERFERHTSIINSERGERGFGSTG